MGLQMHISSVKTSLPLHLHNFIINQKNIKLQSVAMLWFHCWNSWWKTGNGGAVFDGIAIVEFLRAQVASQ